MARPQKPRRVCCMPNVRRFGALGERAGLREVVTLTVDEYETIRLIDLEGMTQEECANKMMVARTTVQSIYISARKKLAELLVNGKTLHIEGGNFNLCDGSNSFCAKSGCGGRGQRGWRQNSRDDMPRDKMPGEE